MSHRKFTKCKYVPCSVDGCKASHHKLLHSERRSIAEHIEASPAANHNVITVNHVSQAKTYLKVVPVELTGPLGTIVTHALLDEGSMMTLVERHIADKIADQGRPDPLTIEGVGGHRIDDLQSCRLKLSIKGLCSRNLETLHASTISELGLLPQGVSRELIGKCKHLADLEDELSYERAKPTMIIGQDNWQLIVSRQLRVGSKNEPVASLTSLGWVLHGRDDAPRKMLASVNIVQSPSSDEQALKMIKDHFSIESLGITPRKTLNDPEERALKILNETCAKLPNENRYEAGLLWRSDSETLPNNRNQALKRLSNLESKLSKDTTLKVEYEKQIDNLIEKGYAEKIETPPLSDRTYYLPHFAVKHPQKGKVRLVFDAACKTNGKSLNDALLSGPDLLMSLFGVLIRFREGRVAVVADIREMFLQVRIIERDRDSLRFLWREKDGNIAEYRMNVLIFGAASSPCTAIFVKNKNADDHESIYPEIAKATKRNFYMDDFLGAFDSIREAKQIANDMHLVHQKASFELRGWASNEKEAISDLVDTRNEVTELGKSDSERTLGMIWNHRTDSIGFSLNLRNTPKETLDGSIPPTKRQVTSAVMSVFDPLGLAAPITIAGKMLIQDVWRAGVGWDDPLTPDQQSKWNVWVKNLNLLADLHIPRYVPKSESLYELHAFSDASEKGYATAIYLVGSDKVGNRQVTLVAGKARVTPLKPISIPRLELQAALLGCRLAATVKNETDYKIGKSFYWSDSKTVLAWIKSDPRTFKAFVAHRLAEIESLTSPSEWYYVKSALNPADAATRGNVTEFDISHAWFTGPPFLLDAKEAWPEHAPPSVNDNELVRSGEERITKVLLVSEANKLQNKFDHLPDSARFSNYNRLLRTTAWVILGAEVFRKHLASSTGLEPRHLLIAERLLIEQSQDESFYEERQRLLRNEPLPRSSCLRKVAVKMDKDGLIKLDGRIKLNESTGHQPILLNASHRITRLIIAHYHAIFNHGNNNTVINELRQRYHIIGLRNYIRNIHAKCQWCVVKKSKPIKQQHGDIPRERQLHGQPPFTATAVDYFGPITVTVGRRREKRWGALYTCLTTRAVHMEVANSLNAASMILTLRRFIARRGTPTIIYSDNGTNFVGAEREISEAIDQTEYKEYITSKKILWKKIPPGAPSMGGAWERMVRSIKTALSATLQEKNPKDEVLHTLLLEAEHVVNSRPLTPVSSDLQEEALTPNHFLIHRSNGALPFGRFSDRQAINDSWKESQVLADTFWKKWIKEYLPQLLPRQSASSNANLEPGDIVLIADSTMPRGVWPRAEIVKIYPGPDGKTRVADVQTRLGSIRRPTSRLILLTKKSTKP